MKDSPIKQLAVLALTVLVLVVLFAGYYVSYVSSQREYFKRKNLRVLTAIGSQIDSRLTGLSENVKNAVAPAITQFCESSRSPQAKKNPKGASTETDSLDDKIRSSLKMLQNRSGAPLELVPGSLAATGIKAEKLEQCATDLEKSKDDFQVTTSLDTQGRSISLKCEHKSLDIRFDVRCKLNRDQKGDGLLDPIVKRYVADDAFDKHERLFDAVVVADQDGGRVLFQNGKTAPTLTSLDQLTQVDDGKSIDTHQRTSSIYTVQLGGTGYKTFVVPLELPIGRRIGEARTELSVCGFLTGDRFLSETLAISYNFLLVVAALLLVALISWPLIKLRLLGPRDRLKKIEVLGVGMSAVLAITAVTVIALDYCVSKGLEDQMNRQLKDFGAQIERNLHGELKAALRQLDSISAKGSFDPAGKNSSVWVLDPNSTTGVGSNLDDPVLVPYPYFREINWVNRSSGRQEIKWTTTGENRRMLRVFERNFFIAARDRKLWVMSGTERPFYVESLNSRYTGDKTAVIATLGADDKQILTLGTRFLSLFDTVLPPGCGFAVIDDKGNALFHSDSQKNSEENLFEECSNSGVIRAAVLSRTEQDFDARYLGRDYQFSVRPIADLPWTLLTFRDEQSLRTVNLQVLFHWALLLAIYLVVSVPLGLLILLGLRKRAGWLWPDKQQRDAYLSSVLAIAVLAALFAALVCQTAGWLLVVIAMIAPALGVILTILIVGGRGTVTSLWLASITSRIRLRAPSHRSAYVALWASMLVLGGVLPSIAFFKAARQVEMSKYAKASMLKIASALQKRENRIKEESQYLFGPESSEGKGSAPSMAPGTASAGAPGTASAGAPGTASAGAPGTASAGAPGTASAGWRSIVSDSSDANRAPVGSGDAELFKVASVLLRANGVTPDRNGGCRLTPREHFVRRRLAESFDNYSGQFMETRTIPDAPNLTLDDGEPLLSKFVPHFDRASLEMMFMTDAESADFSWTWGRGPGKLLMLQKNGKALSTPPPITLAPRLPPLIPSGTRIPSLLIFPFAVILGALCYLCARLVASRVMLLRVADPLPFVAPGSKPIYQNTLVLRSVDKPNLKWDPELFAVIDLMKCDLHASWATVESSNQAAVVINHFEAAAHDPGATAEKLKLIKASLNRSKIVVAVSTLDPLLFAMPASTGEEASESVMAASTAAGSSSEESVDSGRSCVIDSRPQLSGEKIRAQWVGILKGFDSVVEPPAKCPEADPKSDPLRLSKALMTGNRPWLYLEKIRQEVAVRRMNRSLDRANGSLVEDLLEEVNDKATRFHRQIWATCSPEERKALWDLARDGVINGTNPELRQLMKRGLVVRLPAPALMDESFRRFVLGKGREEDLVGQCTMSQVGWWHYVRLPMLFVFLALGAFVLLVQPEIYDSTVGLLSTLSGGALTVYKLVDTFGKRRT
jgi:hypothetical protein